ncbi:MAG: serine/threonine protein kinase, partial [Candidatus Eremiobacteraeota bacterium]|nr:serine/threonine protein kinase [Candidatus Eremiobacteraeota bacterium]
EEEDESPLELLMRKFDEEVAMLRRLDCPGIPAFVDEFEHEGARCIVMDFIEGEDLEHLLTDYLRLTGQPVPAERVVDIAIQLCRILEYLHKQQPEPIIHRDVKPANIILRRKDRQVYLVDFGLARGVGTDHTKTLVGTIGYAPLEQFEGKPEARSDQYSLGATMHHLLTAEAPSIQLEPLSMTHPDIHPELAAIIDRATSVLKKDRYDEIGQLRQALVAVMPKLHSNSTFLQAPNPAPLQASPATEVDVPVKKMAVASEAFGENRRSWTQTELDLSDIEDLDSRVRLWRVLPVQLFLAGLLLLGVSSGCRHYRTARALALAQPLMVRQGALPLDSCGLHWEHEWLVVETLKARRAGVVFSTEESGGLRFRFSMGQGEPTALVFLGPVGVLFSDDPAANRLRVQLAQVTIPTGQDAHLLNFVAYRLVGSPATIAYQDNLSYELVLPETEEGNCRLWLDPADGVRRELLAQPLGVVPRGRLVGAVVPLPEQPGKTIRLAEFEVIR